MNSPIDFDKESKHSVFLIKSKDEKKQELLKKMKRKNDEALEKEPVLNQSFFWIRYWYDLKNSEEKDLDETEPPLKRIKTSFETDSQILLDLKDKKDSEVVARGFNMELTKRDLNCLLKPKEFLNDQVINFYLNLLQKQSPQRCWCMNTFFYTKLWSFSKESKKYEYKYENVRKWSEGAQWDLVKDLVSLTI